MPSKAIADSPRNQTPSPMEQTQRKPAAWARGSTNPVTQRPVGASSANGVTGSSNKSTTPQKGSGNASKESSSPDRQAHEKLTLLLAQSQGLSCSLSLRNGEKYTGIFSAALTDPPEPPRYLLKMVKKAANDAQANGTADSTSAYVGTGPQFQKAFPIRDVAGLQVDGIQLIRGQSKSGQNGTSRFRTDADISSSFVARERELKPWDGGADTSVDLSLDNGNKGSKTWDQFETNERLYGVTTNYDESFYTTTIDTSHPEFKEREAKAERLAREIETSGSTNAHVLEERGLKVQDDPGEDEESKYSGVRRDHTPLSAGQSSKYLPPMRRAPTGTPTVSGAPVDPAIISASIAKNDKSAAKTTKDDENQAPAPAKTPSPAPQAGTKEDPPKDPAKPNATKAALDKVLPSQTKLSPSSKDGSATATVEKDVVNAFKAFHATEKLRAREQQQQAQRRDKAVKLNDLKKFSQNFKLHTLVPDDLIPILAKEKIKQEEIVAKARKNFEELKVPAVPAPKSADPAPATITTEQKPPTKPATVRATSTSTTTTNTTTPTPTTSQVQPTGPADRSNQKPANRQSPSSFTQSVRGNENRPHQQIPSMPRNGHTQFGQKLNAQYNPNRQSQPPPMQHLQDPRVAQVPGATAMPAMPAMQAMHGMPAAPGVPAQTRLQYTAKIPEFKPNPAAHTFQPGPNSSGAASPVRPAQTPMPKVGNFFDGRRPLKAAESRSALDSSLNIIKHLLKEAESKDDIGIVNNGGIRKVFYPPVWDVPDDQKEVKYPEIFEKAHVVSTPPLVLPPHGMAPHHGHPMHIPQGMPIQTGHTPHHTPRHHAVQPHMGQNGPPGAYDDQRMQFSHSTSSMHPSPRPPPPYMNGYGTGAQPVPMFPQQMPYGMSPGGHPMTMRQVSGGSQFMPPTGPAGMGGPMANQIPTGPYMNQQVAMFSPVPNQAFPHHNGQNSQHTPPGGYPSPRPTHMMAHSVSQQSHPQPVVYVGNQHTSVYGQPPTGPMGPMRPAYPPPNHHYGSSPHQHHQFPQQMRGTPSATYVQPTMMPTNNHMMQQGMPPAVIPAMQADGPEDVK